MSLQQTIWRVSKIDAIECENSNELSNWCKNQIYCFAWIAMISILKHFAFIYHVHIEWNSSCGGVERFFATILILYSFDFAMLNLIKVCVRA